MEQLALTRSQAESYYPDAVCNIIAHLDRTQPSLRGFRIVEGRTSEVRLRVLDGHHDKRTNAQPEADGGV